MIGCLPPNSTSPWSPARSRSGAGCSRRFAAASIRTRSRDYLEQIADQVERARAGAEGVAPRGGGSEIQRRVEDASRRGGEAGPLRGLHDPDGRPHSRRRRTGAEAPRRCPLRGRAHALRGPKRGGPHPHRRAVARRGGQVPGQRGLAASAGRRTGPSPACPPVGRSSSCSCRCSRGSWAWPASSRRRSTAGDPASEIFSERPSSSAPPSSPMPPRPRRGPGA